MRGVLVVCKSLELFKESLERGERSSFRLVEGLEIGLLSSLLDRDPLGFCKISISSFDNVNKM